MLPQSQCATARAQNGRKRRARRAACSTLRIDAYGARGAASVREMAHNKLLSALIADSEDSFKLRHLERDIFAHPDEPLPAGSDQDRLSSADPSQLFTMLWPRFAAGHGDPFRHTLMPMALERARGGLPLRFGVSMWKYADRTLHALRRLNRTFCATERSGAGLARCRPACYDRLQICAPLPRARELGAYYAAMYGLDSAAYGLPDLALAQPALSASRGALRVLLAARVGRRFVRNMPELAAACDGARVLGHTLSCECVRLGSLAPDQLVARMRSSDVAVFMCAAAPRASAL